MEWSTALLKIGDLLSEGCVFDAGNGDQPRDSSVSIGICLPIVDYAAFLLCVGICSRRITEGPPKGHWNATLPHLVGKVVKFALIGAEKFLYTGTLVEWNQISYELRFNLSEPNIYAGPYKCQSGQVACIAEAGAGNILPVSSALYLDETASLLTAITVAGNLSRLSEELSAKLGEICAQSPAPSLIDKFIDNIKTQRMPDLSLGAFIRANCSQTNFSPIYTNVQSNRKNINAWSRFSIIEASSRLFEHTRAARGKCRIVLFGRNEPGYSSAVQAFDQEVATGYPITNQIIRKLDSLPSHIAIKAFLS